MKKNTNKSPGLIWVVAAIWGLVFLLVVGGAFIAYRIYLVPSPVLAAQLDPPPSPSPQPTGTDTLQPTQPPTETPLPTPTETRVPENTTIPTNASSPTPTLTPTPAEYFEGPIVIGYSVAGRPLEVFRFGTGPKRYMIVAGIHGGYEINTINMADELIAHLRTSPELIPGDATLFILRSLNPDGEALPHKKEGRANARGVDLNRSFPVEWSQTWDKTGCWDLLDLHGGEFPASEPEAVAIMVFVIENPLVAMVSYHAAAPGFYPAEDPNPNNPISIELAKYLSKASGYPYPAYYTGCYMTGSMVDWVAATGAAAVDLELSNHWDTEFEINLALVKALVKWEPGE